MSVDIVGDGCIKFESNAINNANKPLHLIINNSEKSVKCFFFIRMGEIKKVLSMIIKSIGYN